jgi:hypothetical protein
VIQSSQQHCSFKGEGYKHLLANMGLSVPRLYKQYTQTYEAGGVHFVDFNVDADFGDCIDGLVVAELPLLKAKKRARYMRNHRQINAPGNQ